MLTALISSVLGMVGGLLPDILKEVRDGREHRRELERMDKNAEIQLRMLEKQTDAKLAEIDAGVVVEEMKAFRAQMENIYKQQQPVGIRWIDGFNALIRPATAALLMLLFFGTAVAYSWGIIEQYRDGRITDLTNLATAIWGSLVGESIQAVMGYLFGYRSTRTVVTRLSSPQPAGR
jgi:phytoene dehydrogenase-like protein